MSFRSRSTLFWLAFAAAAFSAGPARAGLPLDLGLYRPLRGKVFLEFGHVGMVDKVLKLSPAPEYVRVADMDRDGIADIVTYSAGVWTVDFDQDGVPDATYYLGSVPGDVPLLGDVDGDGRIDLVIYRDGIWYSSTHRDGVVDRIDALGGIQGDVPLLGDLNCNGVAVRMIYRSGQWFADLAGDGKATMIATFGGGAADVPFVADWDGDCNADLGVFRDGEWLVLVSPLSNPELRTAALGAAGDLPLAGRLDHALASPRFRHLLSHFGVYRPSDLTFNFRMTAGPDADLALYPGVGATHVLAGDLDGNGKSSLILYNNGIWLVDRGMDGTADDMYALGGLPQDVPLIGDVDGDGRADLVIYRDGAWYVDTARNGTVAIEYNFGGVAGDIPVLADVDGDGKADFGIYRDGIWFFDTQRDGSALVIYALGGVPGDVPLVADWNGDGKPDLVIYRGGQWFVCTDPASRTVSIVESFGLPTDIPISGNFVVETTADPVLFSALGRPIRTLGLGILAPTIADFNGDGHYEPLGGRNAGGPTIEGIDLAAAGLASLYSKGRVNRDCRAADFNGDGVVDLVCNTYSSIGTSISFARLFLGDGNGGFTEDPAFAALDIRGYGETILAADFNNDGAVDLFFPYYSHNDPAEHSYLLINDGTGHFTDVADAAGVALRAVPLSNKVEGAQAVDLDGDGWIDFYVGGRLFHNNGDLTFTDVTAAVGLPGSFDEGIKFLDWNNDGNLDLVIHHPAFGLALWEFDGTNFTRRDVLPQYLNSNIYGLQVADFNGDGREDLIVAGGPNATSYVLLNTGARFERDPVTLIDDLSFGPISVFDYDGDGAIDLVLTRGIRPTVVARNISPGINRNTMLIQVVDAAGRRNQFGRVVRIRPGSASGVTLTRVVDGGSGILAQTPYTLTIPTPWPGQHQVDVRFGSGTVSFSMQAGERIRVYADGRTEAF
ncbi:MAG: VCBS repeat-containing protein [Casimicrobiaceae bacterium]